MKALRIIISVLAIVLFAGCSHVGSYSPGFVFFEPTHKADKFDGKCLVVTDKRDDAYVFSGSPTSFTGGATTLTLPLGQIVRETSLAVFGDIFIDGAEASNSHMTAQYHRAVIRSKLNSYAYEYNQLKNAGFAITPGVLISMDVELLNNHGATLFRRQYVTPDYFEGETYFASGDPGEKVSRATNLALVHLLRQAAPDKQFRILSLDGGGVRGALSAQLLVNIESYLSLC